MFEITKYLLIFVKTKKRIEIKEYINYYNMKMKKTFLTYCCLLITQLLFAQNTWQVSGVITDAGDSSPLIGASVVVQGTTIGTITDFNGKYSISVPDGGTIVFSYTGYKPQTRVIKSGAAVNVALAEAFEELEEVVAIGYGTVRKSDLTGAVSSVRADQLRTNPGAGVDQALQGRVAGVTVNSGSGQPGAEAKVRIRGIGTVNESGPIYVVDGLIVSDITFLSPEDIETTEILKDASATAIYGSRGANGVILISTKKGKEGKGNISFNSYWGLQNRWRKLDLMKSKELAEMQVRINAPASEVAFFQNNDFNAWLSTYKLGNSPYFPVVKSAANPYGFDYSAVETDWQDEVFRPNALVQNYHISLDGGNEKGRYAFSVSYFNQEGTIIGSNFERLTFRLNTSHQMRSWLKLGQTLSLVNTSGRRSMNNNSSPGASILSAALAMAPWDPTHYPDGAVNNQGKDLSGQISASSNFKNVVNPFSMVERTHPTEKSERWIGDVYLEIEPIKNLQFRSSLGIDFANNEDKVFKEAFEYSTFDKQNKNFLSIDKKFYRTFMWDNILTYSKTIGKHSFSAMGGQTGQEWSFYKIGGAGASILNPTKENWYLGSTTENKSLAGDEVDRTRMFSLLGRVHYTFDSKYMITVNFRADGTSKFPENTWGYFPSTALAWRISEESFMKGKISFLDYMKIRAGWGQIGNEKVGSTAFIADMAQGFMFTGYPFGTVSELQNGAALLKIPDNNGKWETTEQWNVGLDMGLFRSMLDVTLDLFMRDTRDMILGVTNPAFVGNRFPPVANVATVRNQGIELSLNHNNKIGDWGYSVGGNVSFIKNELIALNGGSPLPADDFKTLNDQGLALYTFWGYEYEGVFKTDQEAIEHWWGESTPGGGFKAGDAKFRDLNGDGKLGDNDKMDLGNPFPWLTYGLNVGIYYKQFDFQMFFQGVYGNKIYNAVRERTEGAGTQATLSTTMHDVWIGYSDEKRNAMAGRGIDWEALENRDGTIPNPLGHGKNMDVSSRFIESGAYLRLKNISLGYTLPKHISRKATIERARVYVSVSNLLTFTNYTGYDPEVYSGVDYGNYPQARTFMFGMNVDF